MKKYLYLIITFILGATMVNAASFYTESIEPSWKTASISGIESKLNVIVSNVKDKKADFCWYFKDSVVINPQDTLAKSLYYPNGSCILDNKNKCIVGIKYETNKCNVGGVMKNGFHLSLTTAQAVNIDKEFKLGNTSWTEVYQNDSKVIYGEDTFNVTATLYMWNGASWVIAPENIFITDTGIYKFGAIDLVSKVTTKYKYVWQSTKEINYDGTHYYFDEHLANSYFYLNIFEKDILKLSDICTEQANCTYNHNDNMLEVEFFGFYDSIQDRILIDPAYSQLYTSSSNLIGTGTESWSNLTEGTSLGVRQYSPTILLEFNTKNESYYVPDDSLYNNYGTFGAATTNPFYNATGGYDGSGAYTFDGSNDYMILPNDILDSHSSGTVNVWVYVSSVSFNQYVIMMYGTSLTNVIQIGLFGDTYATVGARRKVYVGTAIGAANNYMYTNGNITAGWNAITVNNVNNTWNIYINSTRQDLTALLGANTGVWFNTFATGTDIFYLGSQIITPATYFKGNLDQFSVYNKLLSSDEIYTLNYGLINNSNYIGKYAKTGEYRSLVFYNSTGTYWNTTLSIADSDGAPEVYDLCQADSECMNHWKLDGNYLDSKSDWHGASSGANNATGVSSKAIFFDSSNDVILNNSGDYRIADTKGAVSVWFQTKSATGQTFISSADTADTNNFIQTAILSTGEVMIQQKNGSLDTADLVKTTSTAFLDGKWHHAIIQSLGSRYEIYVDGVNQSLTVTSGTNTGHWFSKTSLRDNIGIGATKRTILINPMNGSLNEIVVYNKTLTYTEVTQIYKAGLSQYADTNVTLQTRTANSYNITDTALLSFWSFNNDNATHVFDETGRNNGTRQGSIVNAVEGNGTVGKGYFFDGVNDAINTTASSCNFTNSTNFTICSWVKKISTTPALGAVVSKWDPHTLKGYWLREFTDGRMQGFVYMGSGSTTTSYTWSTITDMKWHHICMTFNNSLNGVKMYYDGLDQTNATTSSGSMGDYSNTKELVIGALNTTIQYFIGQIDEVRIYNRSLSADEVRNLYEMGSYHIQDWSTWQDKGIATDDTPVYSGTSAKFYQFRANLKTNDTRVSSYVLNHSVITIPNLILTINSPLEQRNYTNEVIFNITSNIQLLSCVYSLDGFNNNFTMNISGTNANRTNNTMSIGTYNVSFGCSPIDGLQQVTGNTTFYRVESDAPNITNVTVNSSYGLIGYVNNFTATFADETRIDKAWMVDNFEPMLYQSRNRSIEGTLTLSLAGNLYGQTVRFTERDYYLYEVCFNLSYSGTGNKADVNIQIFENGNSSTNGPIGNNITPYLRIDKGLITTTKKNFCRNLTKPILRKNNTWFAIIVNASNTTINGYYVYQGVNSYEGYRLAKSGGPWGFNGQDIDFMIKGGLYTYKNETINTPYTKNYNATLSRMFYFENLNGTYYWCSQDIYSNINCTPQYNYSFPIYGALSIDETFPTGSLLNPRNNTAVNGIVLIDGTASDNVAVNFTYFQYKNSTQDWTNISNCNRVYSPYDCLWNTTAFNNNYHEIRIAVCDTSDLCTENTQPRRYLIDRNVPIDQIYVIYPYKQKSVKNGDYITLKINTTDGSGAGINVSFIDTYNLNQSRNSTMRLESGLLSAGNYSMWNLTIRLNNSLQGNETAIPFYVLDNATPTNNLWSSDFIVTIDNEVPHYTGIGNTVGPIYNNSDVTFYLTAYDNLNLTEYIFSTNITGTWVNDSSVSFTNRYEEFIWTTKTANIVGHFAYRFFLMDNANNTNITETGVFNILTEPTEIIVINRTSPLDSSIYTTKNVTFSFNYTNATATSCSLWVDSINNYTILYPTANITLQKELNFTDGIHNWYVTCNNSKNDTFPTDIIPWSFEIDTTYPNVYLISPLSNAIVSSFPNLTAYFGDSNGIKNYTLFINNTKNFTIIIDDYITNVVYGHIIQFADGYYNWSYDVYDYVGNRNFTSDWNIEVDGVSPIWNQTPANKTLEYYVENLYTRFNASDKNGLDTYFINDTIRFNITKDGILINKTILNVGQYIVNISVNDTVNNINYILLKITVQDTTPPYFGVLPLNQSYYNITLTYTDFNATDYSGISLFWINDSNRFNITYDGIFINKTILPVGDWLVNVSVNDSYNNVNFTIFNISILQSAEANCWSYLIPSVLFIPNLCVYTVLNGEVG